MAKAHEVCACDEANAYRALLVEAQQWLAETHAQKGWEDDGARGMLRDINRVLRKFRRAGDKLSRTSGR